MSEAPVAERPTVLVVDDEEDLRDIMRRMLERRGYSTSAGTHVTLLSVRGPRSARIRAGCVGRGCGGIAPVFAAPPVRLRSFERFFPVGTLLRVRVTAASAVGKYTSFRIRARHAPRRLDRCLVPGRWAPAPCPAL